MVVRRILRLLCGSVLLAFFLSLPCQARTIYVDAASGGRGAGSSWSRAHKYLQDALAVAACGDQVLVAEGTYRADRDCDHPEGTGDRQATFVLKPGVRVYGGFKSGGCEFEHRDPEKHRTVLSGDLKGNDGNIVEGPEKWHLKDDNSDHVVTVTQADANSALDGFVIKYGRANHMGGGILNEGGSPTISNCTIIENSAGQKGGGGLYNGGGRARFVACVFRANRSSYGAGLYNHNARLVMEGCVFEDHEAYKGGALMNEGGEVQLRNCTFLRNSAGDPGGAICSWNGGSLDLEDCVFTGNRAMGGGAIFGGGRILRCQFTANSASSYGGAVNGTNLHVSGSIFCLNTAGSGGAIHGGGRVEITNCLFARNSAHEGGAIWDGSGRDAQLVLTHSTLSGNRSAGTGAVVEARGVAIVRNSILWGNRNSDGCGETAQLPIGDIKPEISHCCVHGWTGQLGGEGNISSKPLFVASEQGDFHLLSHSLCVDAGRRSNVQDDLDGKERPMGRGPDMGAYEWSRGSSNAGCVPVEVPEGVEILYWGHRNPDLTPPPLKTAYARADNDCAHREPYVDDAGEVVPLPDEVRDKICAFTLAVFQATSYEAEQRYADLFGPVFRLNVPASEHLCAYVWKINGVFSFTFVILIHNMRTGAVTSEPVSTRHRWWLYARPYVGFDDIDGDGGAEVVLSRVEHCGTDCTSTIYSYYHIADDLSLVRVAVRESDMLATGSLREHGGSGVVMREFENAGLNRLRLVIRLMDRKGKVPTRDIGWALFESKGPGRKFEVKQRHVLVEESREYVDRLVTMGQWDWLDEFR